MLAESSRLVTGECLIKPLRTTRMPNVFFSARDNSLSELRKHQFHTRIAVVPKNENRALGLSSSVFFRPQPRPGLVTPGGFVQTSPGS